MSSYPPIPLDMGVTFTAKTHNDTYPFISTSPNSQQGHYVLITGANKGIGLATAISYAKAGAAGITLCARAIPSDLVEKLVSAAKSVGSSPPQILTIQVDITSPGDVKAAANQVKLAWGKLDILINNAGYTNPWVPILQSDPESWWRTFDVNLRGIYLMCKEFMPLLLKSSQKTIVNIASIGALGLQPGGSAYSTSKLALLRFTEYLLVEHAEQGLLAYCIHPGGVKTELGVNMPTESHVYLCDEPELGADTMVWLTKEKRDWLAGRYISCNWDMAEFEARKKEIVDGDKLKVRMVV